MDQGRAYWNTLGHMRHSRQSADVNGVMAFLV
jgi:hypothetical protein